MTEKGGGLSSVYCVVLRSKKWALFTTVTGERRRWVALMAMAKAKDTASNELSYRTAEGEF